MILTLTLRTDGDTSADAAADARDLGHLLHKHPDRVHVQKLAFGTARVFYPEATHERCTAALWTEVDPVRLARLPSFRRDSFSLSGHVNDRRWAASSLLAVALRSVFSTAMAGTLNTRPQLPLEEFDLEAVITAVPAPGTEVAALFEPLGWEVHCARGTVASVTPEVVLRGRSTVQTLLNQLYVLIPVLDGGKHYWVDESEIAKLVDRAGAWLGTHPQRETIMRRYLAEQGSYVRSAHARLEAVRPDSARAAEEQSVVEEKSDAGEQSAAEAVPPLRAQRIAAVLAEVRRLRPRTVVDLGCGEGALLGPLLDDPRIARVIGTDVSAGELDRARRRLGFERMPERKAARLELLQSSLGYADDRIADADVAVLMEVIEHLDTGRLATAEATVFGLAAPQHVVVTTPNSEHNVLYPGLGPDGMRHPDHRFEFTRAEFAAWAERICAEHGYVVEFEDIGPAHPEFGPPTQMAVFSRRFETSEHSDSAQTPETAESEAA